MASESKQQSTNESGAKGAAPAASSSSSSSKGAVKGSHLTPLKAPADRSLDADDTLFTESFVRKMTPRSTQACKLLGVLPDELVLRSYENFHEHGLSANLQKLRYQDYEQMRQETIAMVREERSTLIAQGWSENISPSAKLKIQQATLKAIMAPPPEIPARSRAHSRSGSVSHNQSPVRGNSAGPRRNSNTPALKTLQKSATTGNLGGKGASSSSSGDLHAGTHNPGSVLPNLLPEEILLEQEQERLRKTMLRQNKEIESMMAYELKVAQMLARQEQKMEARRAKEAAAAEMRREERYRQAEKRRLWEMAKIEEEEKLKAANAQSMARLNAQEQKHAEELAAKDEERKREANRRAAERRRKKLEAEMRAAQNLERQFEVAREREREMEERDRRRREALEEKRARLAAEHEYQKELAQRRVATVLETNARSLEERRSELGHKMDEMESRLRHFEDLKHQIAAEKAEEIRQKEERRLAALNDSRSQLDGRISGILSKKAKHDALKEELDHKAREQHTLKMELRRLNKIRKQANVERLKRMQEAYAETLNEKLSDEARRLKDLDEQKRELMTKRQQNAINMYRQKESLMKMFQTMTTKRNWESLSRLQMKDGAISDGSGVGGAMGDGSGGAGSMLAHAAQQQARARNGGGDSDDEEDSRFPRAKSANNAPVNLLDALNGLNKLVSKQKRKDGGANAAGTGAKKSSIDDFLKNKQRDNAMARSKSQGML